MVADEPHQAGDQQPKPHDEQHDDDGGVYPFGLEDEAPSQDAQHCQSERREQESCHREDGGVEFECVHARWDGRVAG